MVEETLLSSGKILHIKEDRIVEVVKGVLWITYKNNQTDYFYIAGEKVNITAENPALIQALHDSHLIFKD